MKQVLLNYTFRDTGRHVHNPIQSNFRFQDGLIIEHIDTCDALDWGVQALGLKDGILSWLFPAKRKEKAMEKLRKFIEDYPEYA
jgi:hypothetical protein